jgi:DNA-binding CsgD family transcriptional regulator
MSMVLAPTRRAGAAWSLVSADAASSARGRAARTDIQLFDERPYRDHGTDAALALMAADHGLLVLGPAGCGRSALLDDIAIHDAGVRRLWWCRGHDVGRPSGQPELCAPEPETRSEADDGFESLLRVVASQPTTIVVDDAHLLADPIALRLAALAERRRDLALRIVVARRSVPVGPALARLDAALVGPAGAFHLGPLSAEGVSTWVVDVRGSDGIATLDGDDSNDDGGHADRAADLKTATGGWAELVAAELTRPGAGVADLAAARLARLAAGDQRVLRAVAFGLPPDSRVLAAATGASHEQVDTALDAARAVGLVHDGAEPVPVVAAALRAATPAAERARIATALVDAGQPDLVVPVARHLAATADSSAEAGAAFTLAADQLVASAPVEAVELLDAAAQTGVAEAGLWARRAAAALAAGRAGDAADLAVRALGDAARSGPGGRGAMRASDRPPEGGPEADDEDLLGRLAGAAWAHLGAFDVAADYYVRTESGRVLAAVPLAAAGRADDVREVLAESTGGAPADAAQAMADGVGAWMSGDGEGALRSLERSARLSQALGGGDDWPDTPHALLALAAVQRLDTARAEQMLAAAVEHGVGGRAFAARHQLLGAWAALRAGRFDDAKAALAVALEAAPSESSGRDSLVAAALTAALALRTSEPGDLPDVHRAVSRMTRGVAAPEPFAPDMAGELAQLAARVGDDPEMVLAPIERVAAELGDPATVTVPLAWARLLVAATLDDAAGARTAATRLASLAAQRMPAPRSVRPGSDADRMAAHTEPAQLFAEAAAAFADVLDGEVAADAVLDVARRLTEQGLVHEASRLVGAAGLRTDDAAAARALLAELRRLRGAQVKRSAGRPRAVAGLSAREREVARALLDGRTHREVGAELYISAKTVEHHVARIRQKLGATTRADLLAAIRDELEIAAQSDAAA